MLKVGYVKWKIKVYPFAYKSDWILVGVMMTAFVVVMIGLVFAGENEIDFVYLGLIFILFLKFLVEYIRKQLYYVISMIFLWRNYVYRYTLSYI